MRTERKPSRYCIKQRAEVASEPSGRAGEKPIRRRQPHKGSGATDYKTSSRSFSCWRVNKATWRSDREAHSTRQTLRPWPREYRSRKGARNSVAFGGIGVSAEWRTRRFRL